MNKWLQTKFEEQKRYIQYLSQKLQLSEYDKEHFRLKLQESVRVNMLMQKELRKAESDKAQLIEVIEVYGGRQDNYACNMFDAVVDKMRRRHKSGKKGMSL